MRTKQLLRFYFSADGLENKFNNLIFASALRSSNYEKDCGYYAEKISSLIGEKCVLSELWNYLNTVMYALTERDRAVLKFYALLRGGVSCLSEAWRKEIKRAAVKFTRRARGLERYAKGTELVKKYFCIMR